MLRVGLTGGLASGKSFVGKTLGGLGCLVIRNDEIGHQVIEPGGEAYADVVQEFGRGILNPDGSIDRRKLAALVFRDPERLAKLNALVHPPVRARTRQLLEAYEASHPHGVAVVEAAILIETGSYRDYEKLLVAVCSVEQQIQRALARDGVTREEVLERLSRQMPLEEKIKYADYLVDTSGTKEQTQARVRAIHETLAGLAQRSD
ncbi:MAG: dephospho-CoA kinase [Bryobacterales bacterium]|nr:dephospho-CoA kinase [Bryobacterales bacterium]